MNNVKRFVKAENARASVGLKWLEIRCSANIFQHSNRFGDSRRSIHFTSI
jgi:hypothetical protein